jgi:hypothetical protein
MSKTVSTRERGDLNSQCDRCRLWYSFVHPVGGGRFLCRLCLELSGNNRAASGKYSVHPGGRVR